MFSFILAAVAAAAASTAAATAERKVTERKVAERKTAERKAIAKEKRLKENAEAVRQKRKKEPLQLSMNTELQMIYWIFDVGNDGEILNSSMREEDADVEIPKFYEMCEAFAIANKVDNYKIMLKILTNFFDESLLREEKTGLTDKQKLVVLTKLTGFQEKFLTETIDQHSSLKEALLVLIVWYVECEERDQYHTHRIWGADEHFCYEMELYISILMRMGYTYPMQCRINKLIVYTREQSILHAKENGTSVSDASITTFNRLTGNIGILASDMSRSVKKYF